MRIPKYRAYDKKNKKMLEPLSGIIWGKPIVPTDYVEGIFNGEIPSNYDYFGVEGEMMMVDDCELMEWTGLLDVNEKEIFDGDICKVKGGWSGDVVVGMFGVDNHHFWGEVFDNIEQGATYEVIGNIHENPELITQ